MVASKAATVLRSANSIGFATLGLFARYQDSQAIFSFKMFDGAVVLVIAAISENNFFSTVQTVFERDVVGHFGGGAFDGMNQYTFNINPYVRFHAEVPLVARNDRGLCRFFLRV